MDSLPCLYVAAENYGVPVAIVLAVKKTEGGKIGDVIGPNKDGSYDLGPMQINTWWWGEHDNSLSKFGITQESVANDFCQNVAVGSWILSLNYGAYGNWADAISAYNQGSPSAASYSYLRRVFNNLESVNHFMIEAEAFK